MKTPAAKSHIFRPARGKHWTRLHEHAVNVGPAMPLAAKKRLCGRRRSEGLDLLFASSRHKPSKSFAAAQPPWVKIMVFADDPAKQFLQRMRGLFCGQKRLAACADARTE